MVLVQTIFQEKLRTLSRNPRNARILLRNPGKPKNKREKARIYWMIMNENA